MKPTDAARTPLPDNFEDLESFSAFWDEHSSADYEDLMENVTVEVDPRSSSTYCRIEASLIEKLRRLAHSQGISTEKLINHWLQEKLAAA